MISIVTAYYNRKKLFVKTLESIEKQIKNYPHNVEVIAVDDGSDENERLEDLKLNFPFLKIIRLEKRNKWYTNSCIPYNIGFSEAKGEKIIIQNPECLHYGNILKYTDEHLSSNIYLSFACYSLDEEPTENIDNYIENPQKIEKLIQENNEANKLDGTNSWYNHSKIRPAGYHFCTAIMKEDLEDLGGFDEKYALGVAFDDDEFLFRIKLKKMKIQFVDQELVLHQNHYNKKSQFNNQKLLSEKDQKKRTELVIKNQQLFESKTKLKKNWRATKTFSNYIAKNLFYITSLFKK